MEKIIKNINKAVVEKTAKRCKEMGIIIPTFEQQRNPETIPDKIKDKLKNVGLWDIDPINLFRITWKNDVKSGLFGDVNFLEIPSEITGVKARIIGLVGKNFPTGAHKVGAAFGCLVPRLVTGEFDPTVNKAVWPSTGNYCRGGAFDCALLGCTPVAILPEEMSQERFDWLKEIGAEVIATPGCESNVKEIYDACWDIRNNRKDCVIFNQFAEFGNPIWHYKVTAEAVLEVFNKFVKKGNERMAGFVSATGSAGTIGAGDRLKKVHPNMKICASEALQCPTILLNGFGGHRIEGIGDKHIPWVHNARNTDMITAIDDEDCMRVLQLFNEEDGKKTLAEKGADKELVEQLHLLGISSISNVLSAIKMAKYYEYDENDVIFTMFTDSADMYQSRIKEMDEARPYNAMKANADFEAILQAQGKDNMKELNYYDRKAVHNLKYFTWIEQQQHELKDLNELWKPETWDAIFDQGDEWDEYINEFNDMTGLLKD
jgi:cysteine synthase